jgi:hypothetical protein
MDEIDNTAVQTVCGATYHVVGKQRVAGSPWLMSQFVTTVTASDEQATALSIARGG